MDPDSQIIKKLDELGSTSPPQYTKLIPIENSSKKALAGKNGNIKPTYVGHITYCKELDEFVYQVQKERHHLLDTVDGKGIAISKKIIHSLENEYNATHIFVGMRETGDILLIPVKNFDKEWHTENYDEQYYARLDKDVIQQIPGEMPNVFSKHPSQSIRSESKDKYLD
jgi:hypothetical protein